MNAVIRSTNHMQEMVQELHIKHQNTDVVSLLLVDMLVAQRFK